MISVSRFPSFPLCSTALLFDILKIHRNTFQSWLVFLMLVGFSMLSLPVYAQAMDLQAMKGNPKIMIMMHEKVMGVFGTTGFEQASQADTTMMQVFQDEGFLVVDPATVRRNITRSRGMRLLEGDNKGAAATGLRHGAQFSIIGKAISKQAGAKLYGTQMQSIHATLTARVIRNDDARVIATGSARASQAHIDEVQGGVMAIEKAATRLANNLINQILAQWESETSGIASQAIALNITGLHSYRHLDYIMNFLENNVQGVKAVHMRSFSQGIAELSIDYEGNMRGLAKHLSRQRFTGFRLEPTNVTQNQMDLRAILQRR